LYYANAPACATVPSLKNNSPVLKEQLLRDTFLRIIQILNQAITNLNPYNLKPKFPKIEVIKGGEFRYVHPEIGNPIQNPKSSLTPYCEKPENNQNSNPSRPRIETRSQNQMISTQRTNIAPIHNSSQNQKAKSKYKYQFSKPTKLTIQIPKQELIRA